MVTVCSPYSSQLIMFNFSEVLIAFSQFFAWIALGDVDLHFSVTDKKGQCCRRGNWMSCVILSLM